MTKARLTKLDFYFISEIRKGIYEVIYAKDIADNPNTKAHHITDERVCFWDNSGSDHACCIDMKNILLR